MNALRYRTLMVATAALLVGSAALACNSTGTKLTDQYICERARERAAHHGLGLRKEEARANIAKHCK
ncbi:MAG: hypothetical protein U0531_13670 [Dehalococcoidia bacterium]